MNLNKESLLINKQVTCSFHFLLPYFHFYNILQTFKNNRHRSKFNIHFYRLVSVIQSTSSGYEIQIATINIFYNYMQTKIFLSIIFIYNLHCFVLLSKQPSN